MVCLKSPLQIQPRDTPKKQKNNLLKADGVDDTYTASVGESKHLVHKLAALAELLQYQ
jgi:hypothetical protein